MADDTHHIILDHLRAIRGDLKILKDGQQDLKAEMMALRQEIHGLRGDALRREQTIAGLEVTMERIQTQIGLSDI